MKEDVHPSVIQMWKEFITENQEYKSIKTPPSWYFCDNEIHANACANLVVQKIKQATSSSWWYYQKHNEKLPEIDDINVVTDWNGIAKAIIITNKVVNIAFNEITEEYAKIEGEGDKSLAYWKKVHWAFFTREMEPFGEKPTEDMNIICEEFETIFVNKTAAEPLGK